MKQLETLKTIVFVGAAALAGGQAQAAAKPVKVTVNQITEKGVGESAGTCDAALLEGHDAAGRDRLHRCWHARVAGVDSPERRYVPRCLWAVTGSITRSVQSTGYRHDPAQLPRARVGFSDNSSECLTRGQISDRRCAANG